jgi:hypothetical protein
MDKQSDFEMSNASPRTESMPSTPKKEGAPVPLSTSSSSLLLLGKKSPQLRRLHSQDDLPRVEELVTQNQGLKAKT